MSLEASPAPSGKISIVLPVYNGSRLLDGAIAAVMEQTDPDWELVVVDDASTDDSAALAEAWARRDARIRLVRHALNRKLPAALNTGFAEARGELLTWTSDDNRYRPEALARMRAFLDAHPETDIVYCDYTLTDETAGSEWREVVPAPNRLSEENVVRACFLYRRAVHEALGGYDENLFLVEDYDFWLRASMRFRLTPLHEDLYIYRRHGASLSGQREREIRRLCEQCLLGHMPRLTWMTRGDRARCWMRLANGAFSRGELACARSRFWRAVAASPSVAWRGASARLIANAAVGGRAMEALSAMKRAASGRRRG